VSGHKAGFIRCLEEKLGRPLQWVVCLLHCNELPLRHVFLELYGTTKSPDSFSGPVGKKLNGKVSTWSVKNFEPIENANFPKLPDDIVDDLSSDQYYGYRICLAVMPGYLDPDLQKLQISPIVHSRWLTLACRILRFYTSTKQPSKCLVQLTNFCLKIYFPTWFNIKKENKITDEAKNCSNLLKECVSFQLVK